MKRCSSCGCKLEISYLAESEPELCGACADPSDYEDLDRAYEDSRAMEMDRGDR